MLDTGCQGEIVEVEGGNMVVSVDDVERVQFVVENDHGCGETGDENAAPVNGKFRLITVIHDSIQQAIPPDLRRKINQYGEKNEITNRLPNEATYLVNNGIHRLSNDEGKMAEFVEQIKTLKTMVYISTPNPPSKKDDLEKFIVVPKPNPIEVTNWSNAKNKGGTR
ncbi:hypothetical protein Tco_0809787 [Tanacetum coccineum]